MLDAQHGLLQVELMSGNSLHGPGGQRSNEMELPLPEMFGAQRRLVGSAEQGASSLFED